MDRVWLGGRVLSTLCQSPTRPCQPRSVQLYFPCLVSPKRLVLPFPCVRAARARTSAPALDPVWRTAKRKGREDTCHRKQTRRGRAGDRTSHQTSARPKGGREAAALGSPGVGVGAQELELAEQRADTGKSSHVLGMRDLTLPCEPASPRGTSPAPGRAQQQAVRIGFCATDGLLPEVQNQAFFIAACDLDAAGNILP